MVRILPVYTAHRSGINWILHSIPDWGGRGKAGRERYLKSPHFSGTDGFLLFFNVRARHFVRGLH